MSDQEESTGTAAPCLSVKGRIKRERTCDPDYAASGGGSASKARHKRRPRTLVKTETSATSKSEEAGVPTKYWSMEKFSAYCTDNAIDLRDNTSLRAVHRSIKNRESAAASRLRKQVELEDMRSKVKKYKQLLKFSADTILALEARVSELSGAASQATHGASSPEGSPDEKVETEEEDNGDDDEDDTAASTAFIAETPPIVKMEEEEEGASNCMCQPLAEDVQREPQTGAGVKKGTELCLDSSGLDEQLELMQPPQKASPVAHTCATCNKVDTSITRRCFGCKTAYYCSEQCQKKNWANPDGTPGWHKMICGAIKKKNNQVLCELVAQVVSGVIQEEGAFALDQFPPIKSFFLKKRGDDNPPPIVVLSIHFSFGAEDIVCLEQFALNLKMWIETAIISESQKALESLGMKVVAPELSELLDESKFGNKNLLLTVIKEDELEERVSEPNPIYTDWVNPNNIPCFVSTSAKGTSVWASQRILVKRVPKPADASGAADKPAPAPAPASEGPDAANV